MIGIQNGPIILTTTHVSDLRLSQHPLSAKIQQQNVNFVGDLSFPKPSLCNP